MEVPRCPRCGSTRATKAGHTYSRVYGGLGGVIVQKWRCKDCGKYYMQGIVDRR